MAAHSSAYAPLAEASVVHTPLTVRPGGVSGGGCVVGVVVGAAVVAVLVVDAMREVVVGVAMVV